MSDTQTVTQTGIAPLSEYDKSEDGFRSYLQDVADNLFPFPDYREYQDEILYGILEAMFIDGYQNVIVEGPTGIGKSPVNVATGRTVSHLNRSQRAIESHFGVTINDLHNGRSFYTTPQKSLRNQLAEDEDLQPYVSMLKSRSDYTCGVTGNNCQDCMVRFSDAESCREKSGCTYWNRKMEARADDIATITFAMLIVDNYVPSETEEGEPLGFDDRDLVIVDEAHNSEGQASSLFAGFTLSPWSLPPEVYGDIGDSLDWNHETLEAVEEEIRLMKRRAKSFKEEHENNPQRSSQIEKVDGLLTKIDYALQTHAAGRGWVVNIEPCNERQGQGTTKKIQVKPVRVNDFLGDYVWSRGRRRLITSATIPFRGNVQKWADRIGLDGRTKFISKPTPFPVEHRKIHLNTVVGEMSGDSEDENWEDAMDMIRKISSHHEGEKGLIHSVSYPRAERVGESLGDNVIVHEEDYDQDAIIDRWQNSDKDILVSPTMTQGVDLHGDRCRWQYLLKVPYAYVGDNRVSYLLNEKHEWNWYKEEAAIDAIQAVGRAVRGPEPEEAASFYVGDAKFDELMFDVTPPEYFGKAVTEDAPEHWENPEAAPWR